MRCIAQPLRGNTTTKRASETQTRPNRLHTHTHPPKRLAHPRSPIAPLSTLTSRATHAHPTSPRSTGFCAIWDCICSSSIYRELGHVPRQTSGTSGGPPGLNESRKPRGLNGGVLRAVPSALRLYVFSNSALEAHRPPDSLSPTGTAPLTSARNPQPHLRADQKSEAQTPPSTGFGGR